MRLIDMNMDNISPIDVIFTFFTIFQFIITWLVSNAFILDLHKELLQVKKIVTFCVVLIVYEFLG